jgi:hypothetical protein
MQMHVSAITHKRDPTRFVDVIGKKSERAPGNAKSETARLSGQKSMNLIYLV